jgi:hypothetical protein
MRYTDIAYFGVRDSLAKRIGYDKIYVVGKDIEIVSRACPTSLPQIVIGNDPGTLIGALKSPDVIGVIFESDELSKNVVEKASELKKTVFVPVGGFTKTVVEERGRRAGRLRKIMNSAHALGARMRIVTMADSESSLLSVNQLKEVGRLIFENGDVDGTIGEVL